MTFPSATKKSGSVTISKTASESKTSSPGSPRSPGSPLNPSAKLNSAPSVKAPMATKAEKTIVGSLIATTSVKKLLVPPKGPASKSVKKPVIDKSEAVKIMVSTMKRETKSINKPPPLKLNIKATDTKGLQSPVNLKSVPKTPTTPSRSLALAKSPMVTTRPSAATKSSQASTVSSLVTKSPQVTVGSKTPTKSSLASKSLAVSSPVTKFPSATTVSETSTVSSMVPKSPLSTKPLTPTVKSVATKDAVKDSPTSLKSVPTKGQAIVVKATVPVKKAVVLSTKSVVGVKLPTTLFNKSSMISKSPSTASSIKSITSKTPTSSKPLTKEPSSVKVVSPLVKSAVNKSSAISKCGPISPKVKKESSSLSLLSVKSSSTVKSASSVVTKTTALKTKVTPSTVSKNLVPKSPVAKTQSLALAKSPSSPTVKTPSSPIVKTPLSPAVKIRTLSSTGKPLLSPAINKMVPAKLILSPGPNKSRSSSRLSSVSSESLASRTPLKSPMSPKPTKVVTKSKTEELKSKSIRGGQPIKKTINIPGITQLPSNLVMPEQEIQVTECRLENTVITDLKEKIESTITQIPDQYSHHSEELKLQKTIVNTDDSLEVTKDIVSEGTPLNVTIIQNVNQVPDIQEHNLKIIEENSTEHSSSIASLKEQSQDEDICSLTFDFVTVKKDECVPRLNSISQSASDCDIAFDSSNFDVTNKNVIVEQFDGTQSCIIDVDDHFETMNDKLVLGDVPFESDISDNEQTTQKEIIETKNCDIAEDNYVDDVFSFSEDLSINDSDRADSTEHFIHQFMPKSIERFEGTSSISTDDGSLLSRKSYSEAVLGSPKDGEYYFDYDFDMADDCLDCDDEERSVFVEVTEKEFPELKPKDLSAKRRRNKKQKKRNYSNRIEPKSDFLTCERNYNPEDFNGTEFCHYINMMKDCSFYPNGLFSSDSVKLSSSSSLSWLDISVRTTDDDLMPSTEFLSTYEVFQASNLNKDFLTSIIGSTATTSTNETTWFWKSIEGRHQTYNKANITLSLQPRPKHLTTPRFMILLALISEAKGYEIKPSLSEHFVTTDCMSRFDYKIRRLMVQGFWLVGRLIKESLSEDEGVNCGNPFEFVDGDIGFWWAGINMLDWQDYIKECGKMQSLKNCYQFVVENMDVNGYNRHNSREAVSSMNAEPDDFMSELDVENFIHTVRNAKYYCSNCFVDSQENLEAMIEESCFDDDSLVEWENSSGEP